MYTNIETDKIMVNIIKQVGECKIGKNEQNIFSYLIGLIIGQKIKFSNARNCRKNMYEQTGSYNFTPNDIKNLTDNQWNIINVSVTTKKRIMNTVNYFINSNININNIKKENILKLNNIDGIGIWTISTLLIEYDLDKNLFPLNDKHVNSQICKLYNITECDIENFVERWSPNKSIAFWYLWKYNL
jgi:3-methyladenine DNA glycosylase/8-oxoguanine DNA glycosylase